jgi:hypothetical protein
MERTCATGEPSEKSAFVDALTNSQMVLDYEVIGEMPDPQ